MEPQAKQKKKRKKRKDEEPLKKKKVITDYIKSVHFLDYLLFVVNQTIALNLNHHVLMHT